jgi:signal transduction histidine kinase
VLVASGVVVLALAALLAPAASRAHADGLEIGLTLVCTAPLVAWRVAPFPVLLTMCAGMVTMAICGFGPAIGGLPPAFAVASTAYYGGRRASFVGGLTFAAAAIAATVATVGDAAELIAPLAVALALAGMAVGIGDTLRSLHARNAELERLRTAEAQQAVAQERVRIARDVHDGVGHALAGIAVQARAGQRLISHDPAAAQDSLATIDSLASRALAETRASVGLIRDPGQRGELAPPPRLSDLGELVDRIQQEDLAIGLLLGVDPDTVPEALQTVVYRVVQEALSNVVRHAGPGSAEVVIREQAGRLDVEVHDNGSTQRTGYQPRQGQGHGLIGMEERVAQHGGVLSAGPRSEGGWRVRAEIPLAVR